MSGYAETTKYVAVNKTTKRLIRNLVNTPGFPYSEKEFCDMYLQKAVELETLLIRPKQGETNVRRNQD